MERPRISPVINYGALLQTIVVCITVGGLIWSQATQTAESRIAAETVKDLKPQVEAGTKANIEQNAQLAALTATLAQLRADQAAILSKMGTISEDIASLKARTK